MQEVVLRNNIRCLSLIFAVPQKRKLAGEELMGMERHQLEYRVVLESYILR
jgi:hypothetical protein